MRPIKFTVLLIFLLSLLGSKAHASLFQKEVKKSTVVSLDAHFGQKVSSEGDDEDSPAKRKRRPRGIEVEAPQVTTILYHRSYTYHIYSQAATTGSYASFLFCAARKRGPPVA